jgi:NTE family protein
VSPAWRATARAGDFAVVCSGGGARAAYQAGVLHGLARRLPGLAPRIYTGVSAGAINAAYLGAHPGSFLEATAGLVEMWRSVTPDQVFRTDIGRIAGYLLRRGSGDAARRSRAGRRARALVDSDPLYRFLATRLEGSDGTITGIERNLDAGRVRAVAVSTVSYAEGDTVIWVQARDFEPWQRPGRRIVPARLAVAHLVASSALPMIFPAVRLDGGWHGDGGVHLVAPFSPAIHLGATGILGISTRPAPERAEPDSVAHRTYPSPARIGGLMLDAVFLELFDEDARRLEKVNQLCRALPDPERQRVREIATVVVRPSRDPRRMAAAFESELPRAVRFAGRRLSDGAVGSAELLSLMLFVPGYVEALVELGRADAEERAASIGERLGLAPASLAPA